MEILQTRRALYIATAIALFLCYASTLRGMLQQWLSDEDMGHGIVVPIVIAWILWRERKRWLRLTPQPSGWGWFLIALGIAIHLAGTLGGGLFLSSVAFLISCVGAVVVLGGFTFLRTWSFALLLALFMLPKLAIVYNQATLPLQLTASQLAARLLTITGYGVIRSGNILDVGGHQILVAEACNGIRYLLPLAFVAALLGYIGQAKVWARILLVASAVPIAIISNAVRVAVSGASPVLAEGTPHMLAGLVIFVLSLGLLGIELAAFRKLPEGFRGA